MQEKLYMRRLKRMLETVEDPCDAGCPISKKYSAYNYFIKTFWDAEMETCKFCRELVLTQKEIIDNIKYFIDEQICQCPCCLIGPEALVRARKAIKKYEKKHGVL